MLPSKKESATNPAAGNSVRNPLFQLVQLVNHFRFRLHRWRGRCDWASSELGAAISTARTIPAVAFAGRASATPTPITRWIICRNGYPLCVAVRVAGLSGAVAAAVQVLIVDREIAEPAASENLVIHVVVSLATTGTRVGYGIEITALPPILGVYGGRPDPQDQSRQDTEGGHSDQAK
jgi:hypothetical protein